MTTADGPGDPEAAIDLDRPDEPSRSSSPDAADGVDGQIAQWRSYVRRSNALSPADAEELESHLRDSVAELVGVGLHRDEAFLVAVKRMGSLDELSREFAREHSDRLWKQLVLSGLPDSREDDRSRRDLLVMLFCAAGAAVSIKLPALFGQDITHDFAFYAANFSLFALPWLAAFLGWRRRIRPVVITVLIGLFALGAVAANVYPLGDDSQSLVVTSLHLPIALWLVVGIAYVAGDWRSSPRLMDFIRFTGEWFVYLVLVALGGGLLLGITFAIFGAINVDPTPVVRPWVLPCGVVGAVVVCGWLVEAKQNVVENIAPVLTRLFTPLFTVVLLAFLVAFVVGGAQNDRRFQIAGIDLDRNTLILFDLLLVVVLGLLLYSFSARTPLAPPGGFDRLQLALVVSALIIDILVLVEITGRITEFGGTPNKTAALGENVILLANLLWTTKLLFAFLRRRTPFASLERWQTNYLPVYAVWAWLVVLVLPPLFHYA